MSKADDYIEALARKQDILDAKTKDPEWVRLRDAHVKAEQEFYDYDRKTFAWPWAKPFFED